MSYVAWLLECSINDRTALDAVIGDLASEAEASEPGTRIYEWNLAEDGSAVMGYERFADSDAALAHLAAFGPRAERFLAAATPTRVTVFGNPSEGVKEALAAFSPTYYTSPIREFQR